MKAKKVLERVYNPGRLRMAWQQVRKNAGAAGIDKMTVEAFERREDELLKLPLLARVLTGTHPHALLEDHVLQGLGRLVQVQVGQDHRHRLRVFVHQDVGEHPGLHLLQVRETAGVGALLVLDVSTPETPIEVGRFDGARSPHRVAVAGDHAYLADYLSGLRVIDVSIPSAPFQVARYDTPGQAWGVAVGRGCAYVADRSEERRVGENCKSRCPSYDWSNNTPDCA